MTSQCRPAHGSCNLPSGHKGEHGGHVGPWEREEPSPHAPKRKPGRPPLPEGEARTVKVLVALTPDEATATEARATRAGKTLAGWARDVLVRAAKR